MADVASEDHYHFVMLALQYKSFPFLQDEFKADAFEDNCRKLQNYLKEKHPERDNEEVKQMRNFVQQVYKLCETQQQKPVGNNMNPELENFMAIAPKLIDLLQQLIIEDGPLMGTTSPVMNHTEKVENEQDKVVWKRNGHTENGERDDCSYRNDPVKTTTDKVPEVTQDGQTSSEYSDGEDRAHSKPQIDEHHGSRQYTSVVENISLSAMSTKVKDDKKTEKLTFSDKDKALGIPDENEENKSHMERLRELDEAKSTIAKKDTLIAKLERDLEANEKEKEIMKSTRLEETKKSKFVLREKQEIIEELRRNLAQTSQENERNLQRLTEVDEAKSAVAEKEIVIANLQRELEANKKEKDEMKSITLEEMEKAKAVLKEKEELVKELRRNLAKTVQEKEDYLRRLSREMSAKVHAGESNLENISIRCRPMTVSDEYQHFMADVWTEAKGMLDHQASGVDEMQKISLLFDILKISYKKVMEMFQKCEESIFQNLSDLTGKSNTKNSANVADVFPSTVKNNIADIFRMLSENIHLVEVVDRITQKVKRLKSAKKYPEQIFEDEHLQTYIKESSWLAWKMIVQRPPMRYLETGIGKPYDGGKVQNIYYCSKSPDTPGAVVQTYVFPCLYHGEHLMVKGTVLIQ